MTFDIFTIKLIFLFFPGIIGIKFKNYLLHRRHQTNSFMFFIESFILGTSSYLILFLTYEMINFIVLKIIFPIYKVDISSQPLKLNFLNFVSSNGNMIKPFEIIFASLLSIILVYLYAKYILNEKIFNFLQNKFLTHEFYTDTVIDHLYLSRKHASIQGKSVFVRDKKENLIYHGFLNYYYFHKEHLALELFLTEVTVYSDKRIDNKDDCDELYEVSELYLCKNLNEITIEFPDPLTKEVNKNA